MNTSHPQVLSHIVEQLDDDVMMLVALNQLPIGSLTPLAQNYFGGSRSQETWVLNSASPPTSWVSLEERLNLSEPEIGINKLSPFHRL